MVTERYYAIWWRNIFRGGFQKVGTATEKARVPVWVLTLGTDNKWKPDERSSLDLAARESIEHRYKGYPEKKFDG